MVTFTTPQPRTCFMPLYPPSPQRLHATRGEAGRLPLDRDMMAETSPQPDAAQPDPHVMQCMEVWGGNRAITTGISTLGLDAWLTSRPYVSEAAPPPTENTSGGDIHYATSCATGRITRLLLADVAGHGEAAADAARAVRRLLGDYANYVDQTQFVGAVNRHFHDLGERTAGLFATAVVTTFFSPTDELAICNAGHPPPPHYAAATNTWSHVEPERRIDTPTNLPLGIDSDAPYLQTNITLKPGDIVVLYTDALGEAQSPEKSMLGFDGLLQLARTLTFEDASQITELLLRAVDAYRSGDGAIECPPFDDDVTILVIRRNGTRPTSSLLLGAKSAYRVFGRALSTLVRERRMPPLPELTLQNLLGPFFDRFNYR
jgi:sigma-B regulation protein RsbU (phosphoserine phosphatase)